MATPIVTYGSTSTLDLLATNFQSIATIGENRAFEAIAAALEAHNRIVGEMVADFVEVTTDRVRVYGTAQVMAMDEIDEFGTPDTQKVSPGQICGFPLRKYGRTLQWTRTYFQRATGQEIAGQVTGLMDADAQNVIKQIKKAIFTPTNYTFDDRLVNHLQQIQLQVKALINADGAGMPVGPNGETFDGSTHNHYMGVASAGTLAESDMQSALNNLLEHYAFGQAVISINQAQETVVRGFTEFVKLYDSSVIVGQNLTQAVGGDLDTIQIYNRMIGTYRGAQVWIRPWVPTGYVHLYLKGVPKPCCWRNPDFVGIGAPNPLGLVFEDEEHPLRAKGYERDFGIGCWNRTNGVVIDSSHTTYNAPTF